MDYCQYGDELGLHLVGDGIGKPRQDESTDRWAPSRHAGPTGPRVRSFPDHFERLKKRRGRAHRRRQRGGRHTRPPVVELGLGPDRLGCSLDPVVSGLLSHHPPPPWWITKAPPRRGALTTKWITKAPLSGSRQGRR